MANDLPVFTEEDLKKYDGKDGNPIYVAYGDRVIDVTGSKMWKNGSHMKRHEAGVDLSGEIANAPHEEDVLDRFPQVGIFQSAGGAEEEEESHLPAFLADFLERHPYFERHPHPMTVHFPISLMILAPLAVALYLLTGVRAFEVTSVTLLGAGVLFSLAAIPTGFLTWWVNYMSRPVKAVLWKIVLSLVMFVIASITFVWRLVNPDVLSNLSGAGIVYLLLVLSLAPLVSVIGYLGATLTFPISKQQKEKQKEKKEEKKNKK